MDDSIKSDNGHEYPSNYPPSGKDTDLDRAWEILDSIKPGVIPLDVRSFLCGQIVGLLIKTRQEAVSPVCRASGEADGETR